MEFLLLQIRKKAFDPLEHNFIFATLTRFGFGQEFIQWELTLFADDVTFLVKDTQSLILWM